MKGILSAGGASDTTTTYVCDLRNNILTPSIVLIRRAQYNNTFLYTFWRFLNPLKYLMDISNILVYTGLERTLTGEERRWHGLHDSSFSISGLWATSGT